MFITYHASVNVSELRPVICITTRLLRILMLLNCQQSTCTQCTFDCLLMLIFTEKKNMSWHLRAMAITFDRILLHFFFYRKLLRVEAHSISVVLVFAYRAKSNVCAKLYVKVHSEWRSNHRQRIPFKSSLKTFVE